MSQFTHRSFLKHSAAGLAAAAVGSSGFSAAQPATAKPNIIYVLSDQLRYPSCGYAGDIMPTLLGLADVPIPTEVEGADLSHLALGQIGPEPDFAYLMNTGACAAWDNGHEWRGLRNKQLTYAVFRGCPEKNLPKKELLFDNLADPLQITNLAAADTHKTQLTQFRDQLTQKMKSLNDTFPASTWYRDHWIENRIIKRTATIQ